MKISEIFTSAPLQASCEAAARTFALLDQLNIPYERVEHDCADTMEDCAAISDVLGTRPDTVSCNLDKEIERDILRDALSHLNPREKQIIMLRFGLGGHQERTQKEVADLLGISQSYISRLEKRILGRLQTELKRIG